MSRIIVIHTDLSRISKNDLLRKTDRQETALCFLANGIKEVKSEGEGMKMILYFLKSEVDEFDRLLIEAPEKIMVKWPTVVAALNHWKDLYAMLKSLQKSNGT